MKEYYKKMALFAPHFLKIPANLWPFMRQTKSDIEGHIFNMLTTIPEKFN